MTRGASIVLLSCLAACGGRTSAHHDDDADEDEDGYAVSDGDCDDTDPAVYPGAHCPCPEGLIDCDGSDANGCKTQLAAAPDEYVEHGCCQFFDPAGNWLDDCDGDGYCECYGACGVDDPSTPEYEIPECLGE